jgi:hypothetical protein
VRRSSKEDNILIPVGAEGKKFINLLSSNSFIPFREGAAPCPSAIMVKKKTIENSGYFEESFTKEYALYEDQAFYVKCI